MTIQELIKTWNEAKGKQKEAENIIEQCKSELRNLKFNEGEPIVDGLGFVYKSRKTYSVPREVVKDICDEEEFLIIDKKKFENSLKEMVKNEVITEDELKDIKSKYTIESETSYYELKDFTKNGKDD